MAARICRPHFFCIALVQPKQQHKSGPLQPSRPSACNILSSILGFSFDARYVLHPLSFAKNRRAVFLRRVSAFYGCIILLFALPSDHHELADMRLLSGVVGLVRTSYRSLFRLRVSSEYARQAPQSQNIIPSIEYLIQWDMNFCAIAGASRRLASFQTSESSSLIVSLNGI